MASLLNEVVEFPAPRDQKEWPYSRAFPAGTPLYAIQHTDRYFKWCYLDKQAAEYLANYIECDYNPSNWVRTLNETCPSDKSEQQIYEARLARA